MNDPVKALLVTTAALEMSVGTGLICCPAIIVTLLLGASVADERAIVVEKIAGLAVFSLGLIAWLARQHSQSTAIKPVIWGMVVYNLGVTGILCLFALRPSGSEHQLEHVGVLLWPAVILHTVMAVLCGLALRKQV